MYYTLPEERLVIERTQRREAGEALGPWIGSLRPWTHFLSLTYDPTKRPLNIAATADERRPPPPDRVTHDLRKWLKMGTVWMAGRYVAAAAVELHKSGWPHIHAVLDLANVEAGNAHEWCQDWFQEHGYAKIDVCRDASAAAAYCGKYLAKEQGALTFWPLRGALVGTTTIRPSQSGVKGS